MKCQEARHQGLHDGLVGPVQGMHGRKEKAKEKEQGSKKIKNKTKKMIPHQRP